MMILGLLCSLWLGSPALAAADPVEQGKELMSAGEFDKAERVFAKALKKDPDNSVVRGKLAQVLTQQGRADMAIVVLRLGLERDAGNLELRWSLAKQLSRSERLQEAIDELLVCKEQMPPSSPQRSTLHELLVFAYVGLGRQQRLDPAKEDAMVAEAQAYLALLPKGQHSHTFRTMIAAVQTMRGGELPVADAVNDGTLREASSIRARYFVPTGWHFLEETKGANQHSVFITPEALGDDRTFLAGYSVFSMRKVAEQGRGAPTEWVDAYIATACEQVRCGEITTGELDGAVVRTFDAQDDTAVSKWQARSDDAANTVVLVIYRTVGEAKDGGHFDAIVKHLAFGKRP